MKTKYIKPQTEIVKVYQESLMQMDIGSGNTTPEESDAKQSNFVEDDDAYNIWDDGSWGVKKWEDVSTSDAIH